MKKTKPYLPVEVSNENGNEEQTLKTGSNKERKAKKAKGSEKDS